MGGGGDGGDGREGGRREGRAMHDVRRWECDARGRREEGERCKTYSKIFCPSTRTGGSGTLSARSPTTPAIERTPTQQDKYHP